MLECLLFDLDGLLVDLGPLQFRSYQYALDQFGVSLDLDAYQRRILMQPSDLGKKYDKIARWWHDRHVDSDYGVKPFLRAIDFSAKGGSALDVGCGAGGRFVRILQNHGFSILGIDVSAEMIRLAKQNHPDEEFHLQDISTWETKQKFEFIVSWDSIFHLPLSMQKPVLTKLCDLLSDGGVLVFTSGDAYGEHEDTFHYSSIGINRNLEILKNNGVTCKHLELDQ